MPPAECASLNRKAAKGCLSVTRTVLSSTTCAPWTNGV